MLAHLFDIAAEEAVMVQLNDQNVLDGLKNELKSNNSPLSAEATVAQTSAENYWFIFDGVERYAIWKSEDQLDVWSCCKRTDILLKWAYIGSKGEVHGNMVEQVLTS